MYVCVFVYSPVRKYRDSKADSFVPAICWRRLDLRSKDEYETVEFQLSLPDIYIKTCLTD